MHSPAGEPDDQDEVASKLDELEDFLDDVRDGAAEAEAGGSASEARGSAFETAGSASEAGTEAERGPAPAPRDVSVSVEVEQGRLDAEAADDYAGAKRPAARAGGEGPKPDPERFWGSGFEPATGAAAAGNEASEEDADGDGGLAAKLAKLGRLMRGEGGSGT